MSGKPRQPTGLTVLAVGLVTWALLLGVTAVIAVIVHAVTS